MKSPNFKAKRDESPKMPPKSGTNLYDQVHVNEAAKGNLKPEITSAKAVEEAEGD